MPAVRQSASQLKRQHAALCFEYAFPRSIARHRAARSRLANFEAEVAALTRSERSKLTDTGIAGTRIDYGFSFEVARWLARRCRGQVAIDWGAIDDTSTLDELLSHLLQPSEDEYFDGGYVSSREWIDTARAGCPGTDFDWLLAQLHDKRLRSFWSQLYEAANIPLIWNLAGSQYSKSRNVFAQEHVRTREKGMRERPTSAKKAIQRPLESIAKLSAREGAALIDVAMASLAVRHRETYHFNYANAKEVYLADVGDGVAIAVFGLLPENRFPLECTMGYLILSNGVPVGYGGSSILFRQVNTGINIFDEFRGSEASFLWVQVMRVYHALVGCTRFIANPYQFGGENDEGLKSGAFWFYYRLGYRPVLPAVRKLAEREAARIHRNRTYRSNIKTLRKLASCDMHLTLRGARNSDLFDERWIETSSMLATEILGAAAGKTRAEAADKVAADVARDLGLRSLQRWSASERRAFRNIAPIVAAAGPNSWPVDARRTMRELLRAKGGYNEARYAMLLCRHDKFLKSLKSACRRADP
jgi:hypothetical protein